MVLTLKNLKPQSSITVLTRYNSFDIILKHVINFFFLILFWDKGGKFKKPYLQAFMESSARDIQWK